MQKLTLSLTGEGLNNSENRRKLFDLLNTLKIDYVALPDVIKANDNKTALLLDRVEKLLDILDTDFQVNKE